MNDVFFAKRWLSSANVENVVKPPQKPVARSSIWFWLIKLFFAEIPISNPINRQPMMLTKNVPK